MSRLTVCERMHESAMVLTPATAASAVSLYYISCYQTLIKLRTKILRLIYVRIR
jgi:hypothetical protein